MSGSDSDGTATGAKAAAVSNAVVRLLSEYTGRGPTQARAYLSGDLVSVVLQDTLTRGEQSLVRAGRVEEVLATRKAYQLTMEERLVAAVEEILGRTVLAFLSANHVDPDVAIESFVLEPRDPSVNDSEY